MRAKPSDAQRAAGSRYRERNKDDLRRKARERMARRRAELKTSEDAWAEYTARARKDAARYRAQHAAELAEKPAGLSQPRGFDAWHASYLKRHPTLSQPAQDEDLPEWPSSDSERAASPEATDPAIPAIPPPPLESAPYEDHLNYFLDYLDPTVAPDYVPKRGEEPYFQRGKQRWH
ncbi:hypothetical protein C8F04DRAFT_1268408 [Mycena alexandri]|uniref:Uncharacterized protein n=1 Tax=Mycena alexandri TaxID=1745969 RepID=A0AAD6SIU0_9AGAR|nr:hypothetical protein C8F04DRAFT_1268408 [Mycena alexandri]